jgi:RNA polymerase sigma-70 factor (ECF subfamily)
MLNLGSADGSINFFERIKMKALALKAWSRVNEIDLQESKESDLIKMSLKGNPDAFGELVRRHQHGVYNLSYRYMRDSVLAEDMAQEAFLKGFRLLKGFRGDCRFSTWMYRVTSSVCLTELARRKRKGEVELKPNHVGSMESDEAVNADRSEIIRRCVNMLPEKYAAIITMYYLEELSYEEIASAMEIPLGTLKTWMFRARKDLRVIVESELGEQHYV